MTTICVSKRSSPASLRLGGVPTIPKVTTDKAPTALVSWAHRNSGWQDADAEAWQQSVWTLATLLRDNGVEAELDLWQPDPETDWTRWGQKMVRDCDFVVIALS